MKQRLMLEDGIRVKTLSGTPSSFPTGRHPLTRPYATTFPSLPPPNPSSPHIDIYIYTHTSTFALCLFSLHRLCLFVFRSPSSATNRKDPLCQIDHAPFLDVSTNPVSFWARRLSLYPFSIYHSSTISLSSTVPTNTCRCEIITTLFVYILPIPTVSTPLLISHSTANGANIFPRFSVTLLTPFTLVNS